VDKGKLESVNFFGLYTWLALITVCLSLYFFRPDLFSPENLGQLFSENLGIGMTVYLLISTLRGFTLIPSTPLVLAGVLVFPALPLFLVNQVVVLSSSTIVYYMARHVRFDHYFHEHYPSQVEKLTRLLRDREVAVVSLWGFAPMVPSDMIVYVCSVLRVRLCKTLLGISIGEGVICAIYIFGGAAGRRVLLEWL